MVVYFGIVLFEMRYSVSILIPTYNRSHLIERAINSSLNQTYNCEIIVCDHGSSDDTQTICKSYGKKCLKRAITTTSTGMFGSAI